MKNIPFIPGMYPGVGCNPLTGRLFDSPFKQVNLYSPTGATGQTVEFGLHTVTSTQDLSKKLNFGTSVSFVAGPFSTVSVAARLLREHTVSAQHLYLLVAVVVTHSYEVLTTFALKPQASSLLKGKALDRFHASYGHGFIAGIVKGGCYYGLIEIQTDSLEEKRELAAKLSGQVLGAGAARLDAERYLTESIADKKTQISIFRTGGLSVSTGLTLDEMLGEASTFPSSIAENPSIPFAIYRDYSDIPPFSQLEYALRQEYEEYVQCVDRLESLYLQYRDYRDALRSLIASSDAVKSSLPSWGTPIRDKQSAVRTDLAGISAQMETLESLIRRCHETASPCAMPAALYQLSPEIKNFIDSWAEASEDPQRIETVSRPAGSKAMAVDRPYYNVAVVGMTGVGKSALVNYLFGERVAATGLGRPVTKRGFTSYEFRVGDLPTKLFDSWGLEVDKVDEWIESLDQELSLRGPDRPAAEWFHTILYCINAAGSRLQDAEIRVIKRFLESKYQVVVILTKADLLNEEEEALFAEIIKKHTREDLPVIAACSEARKGRRSLTINTFGKKEIEEQIYNNFWDTIIARLPQRCRRVVEDYLDDWESSQVRQIQEHADAGSSLDTIQKNLSKSWDQEAIGRLVREEISRTMYLYGEISGKMEYSPGTHRLHLDGEAPSNDETFLAYTFKSLAPASAGALAIFGIGTLGVALGPLIVLVVPAAVFLADFLRIATRGNANAANSLIETVRAEIEKLREGLDDLENSIAESLKNLRMMASP
jgi:GTP-binding protein EngB required for normal cell division